MREVVLARVKELQSIHGIGLMEAKRMALAENAEWTAQHALDELGDLLGAEAARQIDELVKARIASFPR